MHESSIDWKARAIEQWTADPCGPDATGIAALMRRRREYEPWMAEQLDYDAAAGLEVLDLGCGQGIDVCEFALAGAQVTGIDLTPRHVELARKHLTEVGLEATVVEGDAERLPFADDSFDRVVSNGVLHHTPDITAALRGVRRVLRPGGAFTLILYNRNSWHYWLEMVLWRGLRHRELFRKSISGILSSHVEKTSIAAQPLVRVYSQRGVREMLRRAGFSSVSTNVSPFKPSDSRFTRRLPASLPLGGGWYIAGHARYAGTMPLPPPDATAPRVG